ncbi:MAG: Fe-S cluster assembly protein SufD [Microthrixaceae bacterium]
MSLSPATIVESLDGHSSVSSRNGGNVSDSGRERYLEWLGANGLPTRQDEAWKYSPLKDLLARPLDRIASDDDGLAVDPSAIEAALGSINSVESEIRIVLVDGVYREDLSDDAEADGLTIGSVGTTAIDLTETSSDPSSAVRSRVDGFEMLNRGLGSAGVVVVAGDGRAVERPVHVVHLWSGSSDALLVQPHINIHVGVNAQLSVIESFVAAGSTFTNALTTVVIEADGMLRHYKLQSQATGSVHLSHVAVTQRRGSSLEAGAFMFGSSIGRNSIDVIAEGDRTSTDLFGLYLPRGSQHIDNVVTVEHAGHHGSSSQIYKGVIDDHARGSFSGHIIVDHGTVGTDAHQSNKSLLLDPVAQSDSRPWLEIFADDVSCTHGSAIGQLDPESMFYLRSRGIPLDDARAILVGGFINEVVDKVRSESIRHHVMRLVKDQVRSRFTAELGGEL